MQKFIIGEFTRIATDINRVCRALRRRQRAFSAAGYTRLNSLGRRRAPLSFIDLLAKINFAVLSKIAKGTLSPKLPTYRQLWAQNVDNLTAAQMPPRS